jgi:DNA-binding MarR family transcriptional regulator
MLERNIDTFFNFQKNIMITNIHECDEVLVALRRITRAVSIHSKKLESRYGLTGPQILILKEIMKTGSITTSHLARQVNLSHATVTSILDRLQNKKYIDRKKDTKDKRKTFIEPTEHAQAVFDKAPTLLQETFVEAFVKLETWERHMMIASLQRIASMMQVKDMDAAPVLMPEDLKI